MYTVAADGTGDFLTIQAAVDAVPSGNRAPTIIRVRRGEYHEKLHINKSNLRIVGDSEDRTILINSDYAKQTFTDGTEKGTFLSYTMIITGNYVEVERFTIRNDAGPGSSVGQAVAVYNAGDRTVFRNCCLLGHQDTLFCGPTFPKVCDNALPYVLPKMDESAGDAVFSMNRQYYENCFIQGDVDFIFGPYRCWFEKCTLKCNDRGMEVNGYYTAANTPVDQPYGFVFRDCHLTGDCKEGTVFLGRPWRAYARTVFLHCRMDACVNPKGFADWGEKPVTWRYGEYGTMGDRTDTGMRHPNATLLTKAEAESITPMQVLGGPDGWDPMHPDPTVYICGDSTACNEPESNFPYAGWGQALAMMMPKDICVQNEAKSGRSSKSFVCESRLLDIEHCLRQGDVLLIQFGHNDEKPDVQRSTDPEATFPGYLAMYVDAARARSALPVLMTSIVRRHFDEEGKLIDTHGEYVVAVRTLAKQLGVKLIDMEKETRALVTAMGPESSKSLYVWLPEGHRNHPAGVKDDTHLSFDGAWAYAGIVKEALLPYLRMSQKLSL